MRATTSATDEGDDMRRAYAARHALQNCHRHLSEKADDRRRITWFDGWMDDANLELLLDDSVFEPSALEHGEDGGRVAGGMRAPPGRRGEARFELNSV